MDQVTLFTGFATFAGLLSGYVLARRAFGKFLLALWAVVALAIFLYPVWLNSGLGPSSTAAIAILYVVLIPFAVGLFMGSAVGAIMRAVFERGQRQ